MEKYWKLLILSVNQYIECETEEEVNHLIDCFCKDMEQERTYKRHTIETQYPNYNFEHVTVFDSSNVRQFIYFFDTIEEQCDAFEEEIIELRTHRETDFDPCIDTPLIRDLAYESQDMIHKICKEFDERTKSLMERIRELESDEESNQLDKLRKRFDNLVKEDTSRILSLEQEFQELQTQRDNLVNKNAELEGKLIRYAGKIDELERNNSALKEAHEHISSLYKKAQDELFTARRSRDFWHKKFLDNVSPNDYPF